MADQKLSALPAGGTVVDGDLFYVAPVAGGQVKQLASAIKSYVLTGGGGSTVKTQRVATTAAAAVPMVGDDIVLCNIATGSPGVTLPASATRAGKSITFKDSGGQFLAHPLTLTAAGGELIDGLATWVLQNDYASVTLTPYNTGGLSGWFIT